MENSALNEKLFDALLRAAVCESFQKEIDSIGWTAREYYVFSQDHKRKIKDILRRYNNKLIRSTALLWAKRIAVIIMIFISLTLAGMMSVKAIREQVTHIVTKWYSKYIDIDFIPDEQDSFTAEPEAIDLEQAGMALPTYIPEGYVEKSVIRTYSIIFVKYSNSDGVILAYQQHTLPYDGVLALDSEGYTSEVIRINGYEGNIFIPGIDYKPINLIWCDDNYSYYLCGYFSRDDIIKIAQSITFVD